MSGKDSEQSGGEFDHKKNSKLLRFSSSLFQMGVIIAGSVWGGHELDVWQENKKPVWTIICALIGIGLGLYVAIREASNLSKDD